MRQAKQTHQSRNHRVPVAPKPTLQESASTLQRDGGLARPPIPAGRQRPHPVPQVQGSHLDPGKESERSLPIYKRPSCLGEPDMALLNPELAQQRRPDDRGKTTIDRNPTQIRKRSTHLRCKKIASCTPESPPSLTHHRPALPSVSIVRASRAPWR